MARSFNGTSDLITADAAAGFSQLVPYSISIWVKRAAVAAGHCFYSEGRSTTANPFIVFQTNSTNTATAQIVCRNDAGGTSQINNIITALAVFDGTWHHFLYTQDGSSPCNWQVYVDGVADSRANGSFTPGTTTINELTMGALRRNSTGTWWDGSLGEVAVFHRQLSAGEAASLFRLPASHLAPDHYWPLWGVDSPEPDIGVATHTAGTVTGTTFAPGIRIAPNLLRLSA